MDVTVPLVVIVAEDVTQLALFRLLLCCKSQLVEVVDHETVTLLFATTMLKNGAPKVCTAASDQNPPVNE